MSSTSHSGLRGTRITFASPSKAKRLAAFGTSRKFTFASDQEADRVMAELRAWAFSHGLPEPTESVLIRAALSAYLIHLRRAGNATEYRDERIRACLRDIREAAKGRRVWSADDLLSEEDPDPFEFT